MKNVALVAALAMCVGCGAKKRQKPAKKDNPADNGVIDFASAGRGGGTMGMLTSLLSKGNDQPGPYDEPRAAKDYEAHKKHLAVLELSGAIAELKTFSVFGGSSGTLLRDVTDRLRELASNEKVTGLIVRAGDLSADLATVEELRRALERFKTADKRKRAVLCHTEGLSNASYYLFSVCDRIELAPTGQIVLSGVAAMPLHIKGLLDKLGVRADFLHVGAFKGAAEPLTKDKPSDQMVATLNAILDQSYATIIAGVAQGRRLAAARVKQLIDTAVFQDKDAVTSGLVDGVSVFEAFRDKAAAGTPWVRTKLGKQGPTGLAMIMQFLGMTPKPRLSAPHIGVIYAVGGVQDGSGGGGVRGASVIASRPMSAAIRAMAADDNVKAIVLRVSSGGGSALASEIIWNAVAEATKRKPVIVSMGGVAASGGYYIGCGATKIFALNNTLTGSIGVVGGKLGLADAAGKLGVTAFPIKKGKRALMWSAFGTWSDDERATVQAMMEGVYKTFVTRVASGRRKSYAEIHKLAQGRVWTGAAARSHGLVDEIGGLEDAIAHARTLTKIGDNVELEIYPPAPTLMDYISGIGVSSPFGLDSHLTQIAKQLGGDAATQVAQLLTQLLSLRQASIQTALYLPVVFR